MAFGKGLLALISDGREEDVAAVSEELIVVHVLNFTSKR
jgi:hypothetical protein